MDEFISMLLGELDGGMKERIGRIVMRDGLWDYAFRAAFYDDPRVAFRASWALEWAYFADKDALLPYVDRVVDVFVRADNQSVYRHYSKILRDMQMCRMSIFSDIQLVRIGEKAFDLLVDPATKTATKAWCMDILLGLVPHLDWVGEALYGALYRIMDDDPSPGVISHVAKILRSEYMKRHLMD